MVNLKLKLVQSWTTINVRSVLWVFRQWLNPCESAFSSPRSCRCWRGHRDCGRCRRLNLSPQVISMSCRSGERTYRWSPTSQVLMGNISHIAEDVWRTYHGLPFGWTRKFEIGISIFQSSGRLFPENPDTRTHDRDTGLRNHLPTWSHMLMGVSLESLHKYLNCLCSECQCQSVERSQVFTSVSCCERFHHI